MNCRDGGGGETTCTLKAWGHRMQDATKVFQVVLLGFKRARGAASIICS